jgi:hypothetical protein
VAISNPPQRPDPATYSQLEQLQLGQVPNWDSPDILTNNRVPWKLLPDTQVTVRNLSPTVSAVGTQVTLLVSAFGIGMKRTPFSTQTLTLAPLQQTTLFYPLSQAIINGEQSIGVHVELYHPFDSLQINNHGAQVASGIDTVSAGRSPSLAFPVLNNSPGARTITLATLPNNLGAAVSPASYTFAPLQQINATLALDVPSTMHNTTEWVTVVGWSPDGSLIDGLTWVVSVNN